MFMAERANKEVCSSVQFVEYVQHNSTSDPKITQDFSLKANAPGIWIPCFVGVTIDRQSYEIRNFPFNHRNNIPCLYLLVVIRIRLEPPDLLAYYQPNVTTHTLYQLKYVSCDRNI